MNDRSQRVNVLEDIQEREPQSGWDVLISIFASRQKPSRPRILPLPSRLDVDPFSLKNQLFVSQHLGTCNCLVAADVAALGCG